MTTAKKPNPGELRYAAETLARSRQTLVIATAGAAGAWTAPVYYLFQSWRFYFFSDPRSRHIAEALDSGQAAGTVYTHDQGWRSIQGLQMSGALVAVETRSDRARILAGYFKRFPLTGDFFATDGQMPDWQRFRERFRVDLYAFVPDRVLYLDNGIRFGFRAAVELSRGTPGGD